MEKAKPLATNLRFTTHQLRAALILLAILLSVACSRTTPEAALRAQLQEMQAAASEGRIADFMRGVTDDFAGNAGADNAALHNLLRAQALGRSRIGVTTGPLDLQMQGDRATVRFTAVLTGGGRLPPDSLQTYSITSGWRVEDEEWRVYYAQWEPDP